MATAQAVVRAARETIQLIQDSNLKKGDALGTARIAGILAAKRVDELIPLCHTLPLDNVAVDFQFEEDQITIVALASTTSATGVEMEALMAASVAALTIYDMAKAVDKRIVISDIHLLSKAGGRSGEFQW
jgi:cyclic pyranopterin phosphate synthase